MEPEIAALDGWFGGIVEAPICEVAPGIVAAADLAAVDLDTSVVAQVDCESSRQYLVYDYRFPSQILSLHCSPA